jgi:hypothetical protein
LVVWGLNHIFPPPQKKKKKKKIMREGLKAGYDFKFFIFSPKFPKHFPLLLSHVAPSLPSSSATATERHPCHHWLSQPSKIDHVTSSKSGQTLLATTIGDTHHPKTGKSLARKSS